MPRKSGSENVSQSIRDYLDTDAEAGPSKIVVELKKKGITASSALVSRVKSTYLRSKGIRRRRRRGRPRANQNGRQTSSDMVNVDALLQAQTFANKVGGVEEATRLLKTLSRLG